MLGDMEQLKRNYADFWKDWAILIALIGMYQRLLHIEVEQSDTLITICFTEKYRMGGEE